MIKLESPIGKSYRSLKMKFNERSMVFCSARGDGLIIECFETIAQALPDNHERNNQILSSKKYLSHRILVRPFYTVEFNDGIWLIPENVLASYSTIESTSSLKNLDISKCDRLIDILKIVKHERKNAVLAIIEANPGVTVTDIYIKLRQDQSIVSQMLVSLKRIGVVRSEKKGKYRKYFAVPEKIKEITQTLDSIFA